MQVNSIGMNTYKSVNFGAKDKHKNCPSCNPKSNECSQNRLMVTVPAAFYTALLAATFSGPLTSCQKDNDLSTPNKTSKYADYEDNSADSAYNVGYGELKSDTTVRTMLSDMLTNTLGLKTTKAINTSVHQLSLKSAPIQTGDIMEIKYYDVRDESENTMTYNQEKSTEDTLVYDETSYTAYDNYTAKSRYSISKSGDALLVKKEVEGNNNEYLYNSTFELKSNPDKTVSHTDIMPDGSKDLCWTWAAKTPTSMTRTFSDGFTTDFDNISIIKK